MLKLKRKIKKTYSIKSKYICYIKKLLESFLIDPYMNVKVRQGITNESHLYTKFGEGRIESSQHLRILKGKNNKWYARHAYLERQSFFEFFNIKTGYY